MLPVPPDYAAGLRAAAATVLPLALGEVLHQPILLWMALGGWLTVFADPGGPYRLRASVFGAFILAGAGGAALGALAGGHPAVSLPLLLVLATLCALCRVYGDAAATVAALSLVLFAISLGSPAKALQDVALRAGLLAAGGLWASLLALSLWPLQPYKPVRAAVAAGLRALSTYARALASGDLSVKPRAAVRTALEQARTVLASVRGARRAETLRGEALMAIYEACELALGDLAALSEALQSRLEQGLEAPEVPSALLHLAQSLERAARLVLQEPAPELKAGQRATEGEVPALLQRLDSHARLAAELSVTLNAGGALDRPASPRPRADRRRPLREALAPGSVELRHALRVGVTTAAALLVSILLHLPRRNGVVVTVIIVLQPHSGATLRKGLQRIAGTLVGATVAALLAPLVVQAPLRLAGLLAALALLGMALRRKSYFVYAALITPLFVLMAEAASGDWHLTSARIFDTLVGGGLALLGSTALWPVREREHLPGQLAALLRHVRDYLGAALGPDALSLRRQSGLAHANAEAALERFLDEPHTPGEAEALMALLAHSRRLVGAIIALSGTRSESLLRAQGPLQDALEALAQASEAGRPPAALGAGIRAQEERLVRPLEVIRGALVRLAADEPREESLTRGDFHGKGLPG